MAFSRKLDNLFKWRRKPFHRRERARTLSFLKIFYAVLARSAVNFLKTAFLRKPHDNILVMLQGFEKGCIIL